MPERVIGGSVVAKFGRRTRVQAVAVTLAAALGLTACTGGSGEDNGASSNTIDPAVAERIESAVTTSLEQSGATSAIVGVWTSSGEYLQAFGDEVDVDSPFRAAQAAQPVLCALLLELVADGVVTLDREVSEDLPRQVGIEGITYGQLCTAQSGLADFKPKIRDIFVNNPTRPWSDRELLSHSLAHSPLSWPGLDVHLSDTDALVLARALVRTTDTSLSTLLEQHVFEPTSLRSTDYPSEVQPARPLPTGGMNGLTYPAAGGAPQCDVGPVEIVELSPSMLGAAGATITTASDLKTFYTAYLDGAFGDSEHAGIVTELRSTTNPIRDENGEPVLDGDEAAERQAAIDDPNGRKWGFGVEQVQGLFGRSGQMTGTISAAYRAPDADFTVVVALNNSSIGAGFARTLAFELAAVANEAGIGPEVTWTAEEYATARAEAAICQPEPDEAPAE